LGALRGEKGNKKNPVGAEGKGEGKKRGISYYDERRNQQHTEEERGG